MNSQRWIRTGILGVLGCAMTGCATNAGNGALIGGATGAGIGAAVIHHAGGALVGGALGALTGAVIGNDIDRREGYYDDRYYYRHAYYAYPPPPYETRTTYVNPDGSTTTYVTRGY